MSSRAKRSRIALRKRPKPKMVKVDLDEFIDECEDAINKLFECRQSRLKKIELIQVLSAIRDALTLPGHVVIQRPHEDIQRRQELMQLFRRVEAML